MELVVEISYLEIYLASSNREASVLSKQRATRGNRHSSVAMRNEARPAKCETRVGIKGSILENKKLSVLERESRGRFLRSQSRFEIEDRGQKLKKLETQANSGSSSVEIGCKEASLRRSWAISRTIPTKIEGQNRKFKGSQAILGLCSIEMGDKEWFAKVLKIMNVDSYSKA
uniref:Uncharacterized protein n=1 Tax=Cucumis melo TaxID=3656 RepID=A0A9I9EKD2_CUCME